MSSSSSSSWIALFTSQQALLTLPIIVLVSISSLDAADKQLLASSFPVLEKTLGLNVQTLGYFSLFTNGSYALSLPLWGYLVHQYGVNRLHLLLAAACATWGLATIGIALFGQSVFGQAFFRAIVGVALGSILPLSQTLVVELVESSMRGRAFGFMVFCEQLAGTLAAASVVYLDVWETPYYCLGIGSLIMSYLAISVLTPQSRQLVSQQHLGTTKKDDIVADKPSLLSSSSDLTLRQITQRIIQMPAFLCMVAQGIFGGTPWDMMGFLLLLMDWRGFTKSQIVTIQFTSGLTSTVGGWLGGYLGDYVAQQWGSRGRTWLGFVSVTGGIPFYAFFLFAENYYWAILWINAFRLWGTWTQSGALRPLCATLTRNTSERAQIVALWIFLEKLSGAVFGAPLLGYLTNHMLMEGNGIQEEEVVATDSAEKAHALAYNLCFLSSLFWGICACIWAIMSFVINRPTLSTSGGSGNSAGNVEFNALL